MIALGNACGGTLLVQNIPWTYVRYNGKIAFRYMAHAIVFNISSGYYQIQELGETVYAAKSVSECLQYAAWYVLEYHASQFVPSWEAAEPSPIHGDLNESIDGSNQRAA